MINDSIEILNCRNSISENKIIRSAELLSPRSKVEPERPCVAQSSGQCNVFNCPWLQYHIDENETDDRNNKNCRKLHEARRDISHDSELPFVPPTSLDVPDHIFNLTFNFAFGSSINGIKFKYPETPLNADKSMWESDVKRCKELAKAGIKGKLQKERNKLVLVIKNSTLLQDTAFKHSLQSSVN